MDAGTAENVIPDTARIRGTVRTYSPEIRAFLEDRIRALSTGLTEAMRGSAEIEWRPGYPSMVNHEASNSLVRDAVIEVPPSSELLLPLLEVVPLQLLAYHIGVLRGCDVDQPRNLAKSVTVE